MDFHTGSHLVQMQPFQMQPLQTLDFNITDSHSNGIKSKLPMLPSFKNITVLIIENEWVTALNLHFQLINLGYRVEETVQTYEAAINKIRDLQINLVIMGAHIEGEGSRKEFAKLIYREFQIPVIFLTTHEGCKTLNQTLENYPFSYITKPFQEGDLDSVIRLVLLHNETEKVLTENIRKEKEISDTKTQFISTVSHELRNSLSCIMMIFEILLEEDEELSKDTRQAYLRRGKNTVKGINRLLDDTLVIGEIEHEQFKCNPTFIDVAYFCRNLIEDLGFSTSSNERLNLIVQSGDYIDDPFYELDARLLRHILTNLLSNAIKYSPSDSRIDFRLFCTSETVTFQIQDYGIGIPHRDRAKLFTAFNRATNVGKTSGTGLGLAIVKQCVDAHGGTIELESEEGTGTTITVQFQTQRVQGTNSSFD